MPSVLRTWLQDIRSNVNTVPLIEDPVTTPLPAHITSLNIPTGVNWDELINTPCNRDPTVELEVAAVAHAAVSCPITLFTTSQLPATISVVPVCVASKPGTSLVSQQSLGSDIVLLCGRYLVEQAIATGGSATIYRAKDLRHIGIASSSPFIAIKMLSPAFSKQAKDIEGLKREYAHTLQLNHPNIVRVLDLDYDEHRGWFITMELLDGSSLAAILHGRYHTVLPLQQVLSIIAACGRALIFAHAQGVLHCDFKPGNVQITKSGRVCLLDFGAAGSQGEKATSTTPAYASPQLLAGDPVDERDDLFSLGCTAYELFTGHHPFGGLSAREVNAQKLTLIRPSQLSSRRWHALRKSLSFARDQRQANIAVFLQELGLVSMPQMRRNTLWPVAVVAALALVALLAVWRISPPHQHIDANSLPAIQMLSPLVTSKTISMQAVRPPARSALILNKSNRPAAQQVTAHRSYSSAVVAAQATAAKVTNASAIPETELPATRVAYIKTLSSPPARLAFEQAKTTISSLAVSAALIIIQGNSDHDQRIEWRTIEGSAHPGVDYEPIVTGAALFVQGQTRRTIYINLKRNPAAQSERNFAVEAHSISALGVPGAVARAEVIIHHNN